LIGVSPEVKSGLVRWEGKVLGSMRTGCRVRLRGMRVNEEGGSEGDTLVGMEGIGGPDNTASEDAR